VTWKLRKTYLQTLLDQFGQSIDGNPEARPLLVTEGSAAEKLRAIARATAGRRITTTPNRRPSPAPGELTRREGGGEIRVMNTMGKVDSAQPGGNASRTARAPTPVRSR